MMTKGDFWGRKVGTAVVCATLWLAGCPESGTPEPGGSVGSASGLQAHGGVQPSSVGVKARRKVSPVLRSQANVRADGLMDLGGGSRIISDSSSGGSSYGVNAYGGASDGGQVLLWQDCPKNDPDCMWTYRKGMITTARNSSLAIRPIGGAVDQASLTLSAACSTDIPECTWIWHKGMFKNRADDTLAIRATNGATQLGSLLLSSTCNETDTNCTWTIESARISLGADPRTGIYASGGR